MRFIHVRAVGPDGGLLARGGATVGYRFTDDKKLLELQWALCRMPDETCEGDRFNKDIARQICIGRMAKHGPCDTIAINPEQTPYETVLEWTAENVCGYPIEIYKSPCDHWVSDFVPSFIDADDHSDLIPEPVEIGNQS